MDARHILVFNAGSSSLKFELFRAAEALVPLTGGAVRDIGRQRATYERDRRVEAVEAVADAGDAARLVLARLFDGGDAEASAADSVVATGHRIVHGGEQFSAPVRITASVFDGLKSLAPLAPLHNPPALSVMEAVGEWFPERPMVAVFDTAFFRDLPEAARRYAIPRAWSEPHGIRRYGFHGIAHRHLAEALRAAGAGSRTVTLHLGQGCSAAAILDGRPLDTSMGFTPLEGLVMGTRSGDLDPGVLLFLAGQGFDWKALDEGLNRQSGLRGLSGASDDVRELLELEAGGHSGARLALDTFCMRICKYVGAYAAVLGGVDAIAVGGGIGEHSAVLRARVLGRLGWLGVELDAEANANARLDGSTDVNTDSNAAMTANGTSARISTPGSAVSVHVVRVDEEPIIAQAVLDVLNRA